MPSIKLVEIFGYDPECFTCKPCINSKNLSSVRGINYTFLPIGKPDMTDEHKANRAEMLQRAVNLNYEVKTLPQIYVDGTHIGGFDEYKKYLNSASF